MKVECIPQAICSCTCVWKLEREKHLRITQSGLYTRTPQARSIFYVECPFTKLILKPVSALPSPNITCLVIVPFSFRLSFGATKKQFPKMVRVLAGTVDVHSKCCHVGLKSQILRQTKTLTLMVRKCNSPLTFLSAHQKILHDLHHFLRHNLRCALTISQRLPRKQHPVSLQGFKRLRSDYVSNQRCINHHPVGSCGRSRAGLF